MFKKTLFAMAAVVAISGGAMTLKAVPAQAAAESSVIEVGHRGDGWRHRHHRRCFVTYKRVRGYYGPRFKRVRICPPRWKRRHHRRHHRGNYYY